MPDGRASVEQWVAAPEPPVLVRLPALLGIAVHRAVLGAGVADEADHRPAAEAALVVAKGLGVHVESYFVRSDRACAGAYCGNES